MSTSRRSRPSSEIRATKRYYDSHANEWTARKTNSFHHEAEFTRLASLLRNGSEVLDIGCAGGILVPLFLGIGRHLRYTGLDISESFLKIARRRYPRLRFLRGNIADAKTLPKKKFDGFVAAAVLMHVPRDLWDETFHNIERLMRPGAVGYLTLPVEHPSGDRKHTDPRHFTLVSETEQRAYLRDRGWTILKRSKLKGFIGDELWRGYIVKLS
ncbi:MAG TPA: class I SAM-dependent methyltransferase [Candidatus Paceibacterota bacterium]|nr:class I SAM-dependent methyltransferase [Candidatus Paceibacterota bacterium]